MQKRRDLVVVGAVVVAALGIVWHLAQDDLPEPEATATLGSVDVGSPTNSAVSAPAESEPQRTATSTASATPASSAATLRDEATLMATLRKDGPGNPLLALTLAREGNQRFPGSADAAERSWYVVKSLTDLGRFAEAHSEAVTMVDTYKDTPFALDVERHVLVNPGTHPAERGADKP